MFMLYIDLNCDLGESFGRYSLGNDEKLLEYVTSVNIACGFHAGDPIVMEKTVKMAVNKGVAIGAHPGYLDLMGFGRRDMSISNEEARAYIIYQIGALKSFVEINGGRLQHVKPHGALYNAAAKDYWLARAMADAIYKIDKNIIFMGLANSTMLQAAVHAGLRTAHEVFADRAYKRDGTLVSRQEEGALIYDVDCCAERVLGMLTEGKVRAKCGTDIDVKADSVCIHGDNDKAVEFVKAIRERLQSQKVGFKDLSHIL
jgi:UPF0271 protein